MSVTLQWVGDISLNGLFCSPQYHCALSESLRKLATDLGNCDLRVLNWEAPLWGDGGVNMLKVPRLCTTVEAARCVLPFKPDVALMANNHAYDCLEKGFENTVQFFEQHGIAWLGAGRNQVEARRSLIMARGGRRLGLLNCVAADTNPNIPASAGVCLNFLQEDVLLAETAALARECDVVLVHLHWGVDWTSYPSPAQRRFARSLIDAGAAVVVGHHAHFLQGHEPWGNGHIFYGMGNFLFGDSNPGRPLPDVAHRSAIAECVFDGSKCIQARLVHVRQQNHAVLRDPRPCRQREDRRLSRALGLPDDRYARFWRRYRLVQALVVRPWRFVADAGGPIAALTALRCRHFAGLLRQVVSRSPG